MDSQFFNTLGLIAGIGGISIGLILTIYKEIIRKKIFPNLTKVQGYNILRLIIILTFTTGIIGLVGWLIVKNPVPPETSEIKNFDFIEDKNNVIGLVSHGTLIKSNDNIKVELIDGIITLDTNKFKNFSLNKIIISHAYSDPLSNSYRRHNSSSPMYLNENLSKTNISMEFSNFQFTIPLNHGIKLQDTYLVIEIYDEEGGYTPFFSEYF